jgi:lipid A 3-O-deacylase
MNQIRKKLMVGLLFAGLIWSLPAQPVGAFEAQDMMEVGTIELGVLAGNWQAFTGLGNGTNANRSAIFVLPQIGIVATDKIEFGYLSGAVEVLAEPVAAQFYQPFDATLAGFSIVGRYNFLSFGRWMPYYDWGMGVSWTDLYPQASEQSTPFNFLLETGPGVHYFITPNWTINGALRLHHISNANIGTVNTGINAILGLIGVSYFFN